MGDCETNTSLKKVLTDKPDEAKWFDELVDFISEKSLILLNSFTSCL